MASTSTAMSSEPIPHIKILPRSIGINRTSTVTHSTAANGTTCTSFPTADTVTLPVVKFVDMSSEQATEMTTQHGDLTSNYIFNIVSTSEVATDQDLEFVICSPSNSIADPMDLDHSIQLLNGSMSTVVLDSSAILPTDENDHSYHAYPKTDRNESHPHIKWQFDDEQLLFDIRSPLEGDFTTTKSTQRLWEYVASKIQEQGFNASPEQCYIKWGNSKRAWKVTADHNAMPDVEPQTCKFYDDFNTWYDNKINNRYEVTMPDLVDKGTVSGPLKENKWTKTHEEFLVQTRASMEKEFLTTKIHVPLWKEIASKLKTSGIVVSGHKCNNKWKRLKRIWQICSGINKAAGAKIKTCKFFSVFQTLYGKRRIEKVEEKHDDCAYPKKKPRTKLKPQTKLKREQKQQERENRNWLRTQKEQSSDMRDIEDAYGGVIWRGQHVKKLFEIRSNMDEVFQSSKHRALLWDQIAENLHELGCHATRTQCREKWRGLRSKWRVAASYNKHVGLQVKTSLFYNEFMALYGHEDLKLPSQVKEAPFVVKTERDDIEENDDDDDVVEPLSPPHILEPEENHFVETPPTDDLTSAMVWLRSYFQAEEHNRSERERREEERHGALMDMLSRLVNAVEQKNS